MEILLQEKAATEWVRRTFEGWERYPTNLSNYDRYAADGETLNQELSGFSEKLFCPKDCGISVDVLEIVDQRASRGRHYRFSSEEKLLEHLALSSAPKVRIISIAQTISMKPLNITEEAMRKTLTYHGVTPDFLTNLFCCGNHPQASEGASGYFCTYRSLDGYSELMYTLKYVERNGRSQGNNWSIRQTIVYHQHTADGADIWIILHPKTGSVFQTRLVKAFSDTGSIEHVLADPATVHLLLLSSYADNWRWYLAELSQTFLSAADIALTIDLSDTADYRLSFPALQSLRYLEDKIFPVMAALRASVSVVDCLKDHYKHGGHPRKKDAATLALRARLTLALNHLHGNLTSAETLRDRIGGIIHLLGDALNHRGQTTAMEVNRHMLGLTRESVDDSATVRVVGVMTLIYLPATFVATLLGMNLLTFEYAASRIKIAKDFWIFIAMAVPLTLLTVGCWVFLSFRKKIQRESYRSQTDQDQMCRPPPV